MPRTAVTTCSLALFLAIPFALPAAEWARLDERNWDRLAPQGKEVDAIYGDFVLRNDRVTCVVADPIAGRNANLTVHNVGGCIIDLTRLGRPNDQLGCFYPGAGRFQYQFVWADAFGSAVDGKSTKRGNAVTLICNTEKTAGAPLVTVIYKLEDGWDFVECTTRYENPGEKPLAVEIADSIRADRTFQRSPGKRQRLFWVYDKWFHQGYGVVPSGHVLDLGTAGRRGVLLRYLTPAAAKKKPKAGGDLMTLKPGEAYVVSRRIFPAKDLFELNGLAEKIAPPSDAPQRVTISVTVHDKQKQPIAGAEVAVFRGRNKDLVGMGFTSNRGDISFSLPRGGYRLEVAKLGRERKAKPLEANGDKKIRVELVEPGYVVGHITSNDGGPIPCKVQFRGKDGTADPSFGVDSGHTAVRNLVYSHNGRFKQAIQPGKYDVVISYGPEHDAVFTSIEVQRGEEAKLAAKLIRSVQTPGWVSADFHNHASPSGDNTSSVLGRVQNILCEQIEFAPCTEHNRIDTYTPFLKQLGVEHLVATCSGIELTGTPLPLNHQNAFPLVYKPHLQDGGGPRVDADPEKQISRLALWDGGSEKLVQQNHPDIGWLFFDKDGDGKPDGGYKKSIPYIDVIEIHPLDSMLKPPVFERNGRTENNRIFNWLQLLNQGHRLTGVVNTDSHYTFHESGFWRNYVKSPVDEPVKIKTLDIVHASERGNVTMTTAPFMEVRMTASQPGEKSSGTAGDDVAVPGGKATLHVRVQCANWYDIDRVQVYLNGRPAKDLNFSRFTTPGKFAKGVVKFNQEIPLKLDSDAHVIVMAVGEKSKLGVVQGPKWGEIMPIAVSNPIYADVDGGGFKPNKDTLGAPLPVKGGRR